MRCDLASISLRRIDAPMIRGITTLLNGPHQREMGVSGVSRWFLVPMVAWQVPRAIQRQVPGPGQARGGLAQRPGWGFA